MKIGATAERPARPLFGPVQPPVGLTDLGLAEAVVQAPTTEEAWLTLVDRLPRGGAHAATRLFVTLDRVNAASRVVAKALGHIGQRRTSGEPVPPSWIDRLAELVVEEYDALVAWDDAAHDGAICPAWVEVPPGERAVPSTEQSWIRVSRLVARAVQVVPGDGWNDCVHDSLMLIDPYREPGDGEVERIKTACRDAVRLAIRTTYASEETRR